MKMRKLTALLLVLLLALGLAGCGGETVNFTTDKLNVWIWDEAQLEAWQGIADTWGAENQIQVEISVKSKDAYWEEVDRGLLPDILWMDSRHLQNYVNAGMLLRLDQQIKSSDLKLDRYYDEVVESYQVDGFTYGIPRDSSVMALWYNKTLFDSMNVDYPDESWTWEDLADAAQKLTSRHGGKYGLAIDMDDMTDGWYNLVYAYGGSILKTDQSGNVVSGWGDPGTLEAMNLLGRMICDSMPSQPTMELLDEEALFASGNVAMILRSSAEAMSLIRQPGAENWACTMLPYCDRDGSGDCGNGERVSMLEGNGWVISSKTADSAAAFDLLETFCSQESQKTMAAGSLFQPADSSLAEEWCKAIEGWDFTPYTKTLSSAELVNPPIQIAAESWEDYALTNTLYIAWNDPARMEEMLQKQHQYTLTDLARGSSQTGAAATDGELPADEQTAPDEEGAEG